MDLLAYDVFLGKLLRRRPRDAIRSSDDRGVMTRKTTRKKKAICLFHVFFFIIYLIRFGLGLFLERKSVLWWWRSVGTLGVYVGLTVRCVCRPAGYIYRPLRVAPSTGGVPPR